MLVNDWSARDIQRVEYEPLGPFLGKSFATSISAWITPLDALAGARTPPPPQDPPPAPYLTARDPWLLDVDLEIELNGEVVSRPNAARPVLDAGADARPPHRQRRAPERRRPVRDRHVSGAQPGTEGSLAELYGGERWLADGDEVVLRGRAGAVALGAVRGRIAAA